MAIQEARVEVDVAVIGGGIAGLSAALAAAGRDASVSLFEKTPVVGGNARVSAGMFLGSNDFDGLRAYVPDGDPELQKAFCDDYDTALDWLQAQGLPIEPVFDFGDFRRIRSMGSGVPGARHEFMEAMAKLARSRGIRIAIDRTVRSIAREGGRLLFGTGDGRPVFARSVVLATGGFAAGREMLERFMGPASREFFIRSFPGAEGDGLRIAESLGAATAGNMQAFYGHTLPDCPLEPEEWQPMTPYFARLGMLVNRDGRRFVDESASLLEELNAQAAIRQPGGRFWLIFDERIRRGEGLDEGTTSTLPKFDWLARARTLGAPILEAASLDALCAALATEGVDAAALGAELKVYNAAAAAGEGARLAPARLQNALVLDHAPFYALRCVAGITATCGGIAVDAQCRVLNRAHKPIKGLFAAGVDAGGVYGKTYGGFLAWSLVSGLRAGRSASGG